MDQDEFDSGAITVEVVKFRRRNEAQRRSAGVRAMRAMEKRRGAQRTRFKRIMAFARDLAARDPAALPLLVTALGRPVQSQAMLETVLRYPRHGSSGAFSPETLFFSEYDPLDAAGRTFREIAAEIRKFRRLRLDRNVVIPNPWHPNRLQNSLSKLRPNGKWGRWREDYNHHIEVWEPVGLGWVHGGNHSITAGILIGAGTVKPDFGYDLTAVYDHVYCDGRAFRRRHDRSVIADVSSVEMAAIFEIGRLMIDTPMSPPARPDSIVFSGP